MSLQVWLPLDGNLNNQGLCNVTVINNEATINNSGKIGQCYQFGTAASDITLSANAMTSMTTECSICFWIKILSWNTSYATFFQAGTASTAWAAYRFGFLRNNANSTCCFTISNGSTASNANYLTPALELNTWYHIGLCYKTGHCLIYINGTLYQDYTTSIVPAFSGITTIKIGRCTTGSNYQTNCLMNDFRIYDHCLSDKEIEEISKGLVVHLKFKDAINNITYDSSGYCHNGQLINSPAISLDSSGIPRYRYCAHMTATNQKIRLQNLVVSGFTNTYSFAWWEKISSVTPMHWGFSDGCRLNGMYTGHLWNTGDSSNNPLYNPGTTTQVTDPTVNVWHHWVMTGDGTKCRVYQDGVLWAEAKTYKSISGTSIYINGWDSGTNYSSNNAAMADFRIYATTLTATQIKELYDTSASVDNKGNIYARELYEDTIASWEEVQ